MKNIISACLLLIASISAFAQGSSYNEKFQVNSTSAGLNPKVSTSKLSNGGVVICWADEYNSSHRNNNIYAQIYDANGNIVQNELHLKTYGKYGLSNLSVTSLSRGGFIICWQDSTKLLLQIYNNRGSEIGNEIQIIPNSLHYPIVYGLRNGGFVVCWENYEYDYSHIDIHAQMYDQNGNVVVSEFKVNTYRTSTQVSPSISGLNRGGFIICWQSSGQDGSSYGVYAQMYDSTGVKIENEFRVNTTTLESQHKPSITELTSGFIVCWTSVNSSGWGGIYAQKFDENGKMLDEEFKVNTISEGYKWGSSIESFTSGGFIICWSNKEHEDLSVDLCAKIFDEDCKTVGDEFKVTNESSSNTSIASFSDNGFLISWRRVVHFPNTSIFAKYYLGEPINHNLKAFEVLEPEYDAIITRANPQFKWREATDIHKNFPWELTYDLYIDTDEAFSNPIIYRDIQDTLYRVDSFASGQTYFWHVFAKTYYGETKWSSNVNGFYIDENATDVDEEPSQLPDEFKLFQNYPNPFNPTTIIKYTILSRVKRETANVKLVVYDVLGKELATLVNKEQPAGSYEVEFRSNNLSSGIYFYKISAGNFSKTMKMVLMR